MIKISALLLNFLLVLGVLNASQEKLGLYVTDDFKLNTLQEHLSEVCTDLQKKREVAEILNVTVSLLDTFLENRNNHGKVVRGFKHFKSTHKNTMLDAFLKNPAYEGIPSYVAHPTTDIYKWEEAFFMVAKSNLLLPSAWKDMQHVKAYFTHLNKQFPEQMEHLRYHILHCPEVSTILASGENDLALYKAYESLRAYARSNFPTPLTTVLAIKQHEDEQEALAKEEAEQKSSWTNLFCGFSWWRTPTSPRSSHGYQALKKRE